MTKMTVTDTNKIILKQSGVIIREGGASSLAALSDVNVAAPEDGQYLTYDETTLKWIPTTGTGGGGTGAVDSVDGRTGEVDLSDLYAPITHTHTESDITDLDKYTTAEVDTTVTALQLNINAKADANHTHTELDITDLDKYTQSEVDSKDAVLQANIDAKADTAHTHVEADITDLDKYTTAEVDAKDAVLQANIDAKANTSHTHVESDITDLDKYTQAEVDAKDAVLQANIDAKADTAHTHTKVEITDFSDSDYATAAQGTLADTALQDISTQSIDNLSDVDLSGIQSGNILEWDGSTFVAATPSTGGGGGAVDSVDGRTGAVDLSDLYAPKEIESTVATAVQPGEPISKFNNDLAYVQDGALPPTTAVVDGIKKIVTIGQHHTGIAVSERNTFVTTTSSTGSKPAEVLLAKLAGGEWKYEVLISTSHEQYANRYDAAMDAEGNYLYIKDGVAGEFNVWQRQVGTEVWSQIYTEPSAGTKSVQRIKNLGRNGTSLYVDDGKLYQFGPNINAGKWGEEILLTSPNPVTSRGVPSANRKHYIHRVDWYIHHLYLWDDGQNKYVRDTRVVDEFDTGETFISEYLQINEAGTHVLYELGEKLIVQRLSDDRQWTLQYDTDQQWAANGNFSQIIVTSTDSEPKNFDIYKFDGEKISWNKAATVTDQFSINTQAYSANSYFLFGIGDTGATLYDMRSVITPISEDVTESFNGRIGSVTALREDYEDFYLEPENIIAGNNINVTTDGTNVTIENTFDIKSESINSLSDVEIVGSEAGQVLTFNGSEWTADDIPGDAVDSVDGRTGKVVLSDLYAPKEIEATVATAIQPGDSISKFNNDLAYVQEGALPPTTAVVDGIKKIITVGDRHTGVAVSERNTFVVYNGASIEADGGLLVGKLAGGEWKYEVLYPTENSLYAAMDVEGNYIYVYEHGLTEFSVWKREVGTEVWSVVYKDSNVTDSSKVLYRVTSLGKNGTSLYVSGNTLYQYGPNIDDGNWGEEVVATLSADASTNGRSSANKKYYIVQSDLYNYKVYMWDTTTNKYIPDPRHSSDIVIDYAVRSLNVFIDENSQHIAYINRTRAELVIHRISDGREWSVNKGEYSNWIVNGNFSQIIITSNDPVPKNFDIYNFDGEKISWNKASQVTDGMKIDSYESYSANSYFIFAGGSDTVTLYDMRSVIAPISEDVTESFNGRIGTVTALREDYEDFYLEPENIIAGNDINVTTDGTNVTIENTFDIRSESLNSLSDVETIGGQAGQVLTFSGLEWTPEDIPGETYTVEDLLTVQEMKDLGEFDGATISDNVSTKQALQELETAQESRAPFDADITVVEDFQEAVDAGLVHTDDIPVGTITNKSGQDSGRQVTVSYVNGTDQPFRLAYNDNFPDPGIWGGDYDYGDPLATWADVEIQGLTVGARVTIDFDLKRATSATPRSCVFTRDPNGSAEVIFTDTPPINVEHHQIVFNASAETETIRTFLQRGIITNLVYNVQGTYSSTRITDNSDVHVQSPQINDVLVYNESNNFTNMPYTDLIVRLEDETTPTLNATLDFNGQQSTNADSYRLNSTTGLAGMWLSLTDSDTLTLATENSKPIYTTGDSGSTYLTYPVTQGTAGQVLTLDGTGSNARWQTPLGDGSGGAVESVDGRVGVVTLDDLYATTAQGTLADTATQPLDNLSTLTNDVGFITAADLPSDAVISVDGRTGAIVLSDLYAPITHTHTKSEITDFSDSDYATAAQGVLADTATQPLDNLSTLTNDVGFITAADLPSDAVISVDGRTGEITLGDLYAPITHTHVEADITDLDKYTQAEVDAKDAVLQANIDAKADSNHTHTKVDITDFSDSDYATAAQGVLAVTATQPLDNLSSLTNDVGFITAADLPSDAVISVDGRTGEITLGDLYATTAQGALADSALQITDIQDGNDIGIVRDVDNNVVSIENTYNLSEHPINELADVDTTGIISGQILEWNGSTFVAATQATGAVDSVDGRTGAIVLSDLYAPITHTHTESDITDLDKYTQAEVDAKDAALQVNIDAKADTAHTHTKSEITDFSDSDYATAAQGILADSALQSITAESIGSLSDVDLTGIGPGRILVTQDGVNFTIGDLPNTTGFIKNIVEDPSPELAANLDCNDHVLTDVNGVKFTSSGSIRGIYKWSGNEDAVWLIQSNNQPFYVSGDQGTTSIGYPTIDGTSGQVLTTDGSGNLTWQTASSGSSDFASLTDTPADYVGQAGSIVKVNSAEDGLEYVNEINGGTY